MENVNFVVIGHLDGLLLIVHKNDHLILLNEKGSVAFIKGLQIDLDAGEIHGPQVITEWMKFIPFEEVEKETQEMFHKIIERKLSDSLIVEMIGIIEQIKFSDNG